MKHTLIAVLLSVGLSLGACSMQSRSCPAGKAKSCESCETCKKSGCLGKKDGESCQCSKCAEKKCDCGSKHDK